MEIFSNKNFTYIPDILGGIPPFLWQFPTMWIVDWWMQYRDANVSSLNERNGNVKLDESETPI